MSSPTDFQRLTCMLLCIGGLALGTSGCPDTTESGTDGGNVITPDATIEAGTDGAVQDDTADAVADTLEPEVSVDTVSDADVIIEPGTFGAGCSENGECNSGYCIQSPNGKVCTKTCIEECPNGFDCESFSVGGGDPTFLCLPRYPKLCYPCSANDECVIDGIDAPARCVKYGDNGAFCGGECTLGGTDCPERFVCINAEDVDGNQTSQCVPVDELNQVAVCNCTPAAISDAASTECARTNGFGTCEGARTCELGGLTACSATEPQAESCNGIDDDCDGTTDPENATGCQTYYFDGDGDTHGIVTASKCLCAPEGDYSAQTALDCDDASDAVNPDATEACNGIDDNCDGDVDEGFPDLDGDDVADCVDPDIDGDGDPNATDCAPENANIYTGASELCDGVDNNCNQIADEGSLDTNSDGEADCVDDDDDGDGSLDSDDCAPLNANIHPAATESCNTVDDDCDGSIDEVDSAGCVMLFADGDGDTFGDVQACVCPGTFGYVAAGGDCDDSDGDVNPDELEACNGIDDNCDGAVDTIDSVGCDKFYRDVDEDNYGPTGDFQCLCSASGVYTASVGGDCNDNSNLQFPTNVEVCDELDNNCNGNVDEGVKTSFYLDNDGDNFGGPTSVQACEPYDNYVADPGDCNDFNNLIFPGQIEQCNLVDDDCNGFAEQPGEVEQFSVYLDGDKDGFAAAGALEQMVCAIPAGGEWATAKDVDGDGEPDWDCNDSQITAYPSAPTTCGDGIDNDCDGVIDRLCFTDCAGTWPFEQSNNAAMSVVIEDLDGDGSYEAMTTSSLGFAIVNSTGTPLYDYSGVVQNYARRSPIFADVDQHHVKGATVQSLEVLTANGSYPRIYKLEPGGNVTLYENTAPEAYIYDASELLVQDIDRDGTPEFLTSTWCLAEGTKMFRFDRVTGDIVLSGSINDPDGVCQYTDGRVLADLDGDGVSEFLFGNGYAVNSNPTNWGGHMYAHKFDDVGLLTTSPYCTGADCFETSLAGLFGGSLELMQIRGNQVMSRVRYFETNTPGIANVPQIHYWKHNLDGTTVASSTDANEFYGATTDVDNDGTPEDEYWALNNGLWDVNGDGFPDKIYNVGNEVRITLWDDATNTFVENVESRRAVGTSSLRQLAVWDTNGDGRLNVMATNQDGRLFCQQLGTQTWDRYNSLPPKLNRAYKSNNWDNYEPNDGADLDADGVPDQFHRVPSAQTANGNFYSYLTSATDVDTFYIDANWSGSMCLRSAKGQNYSLHVYSLSDKFDNTTKLAPADGIVDGLVWEDVGTNGNKCFSGGSLLPTRNGEYQFVIQVRSIGGTHSEHWPYWIHAQKP